MKIIDVIISVLFAAGQPVEIDKFAIHFDMDYSELEMIIDDEIKRMMDSDSPILINKFDSSLQICTNSKYSKDIFDIIGDKRQNDISRAMMETLSIIAYKQPVTRAEIEQIRGVNSTYSINALLEKGFICDVGKKDTIGRPTLYATDISFLRHFGIEKLEDLPKVN